MPPSLLLILSALVAPATLAAPAPPAATVPPSGARQARSARDAAFVRDFDALVDDATARLSSVPALSIAVTHADATVETRAVGFADLERRRPATTRTPFYIASSTKSFVGLSFALLAQDHAVDLDWTLAGLAPDLPFAPALRAGEVTLWRLLSHSHGLSNAPLVFRLAYLGDTDAATRWRLVGRSVPNPDAPLGTFEYGNVGYNLATTLLEHRLHTRWQTLVETRVLRPLGMEQTFVEGIAQHTRPPPAVPYFGAAPGGPERLRLTKDDSMMQSAGGMYSTAEDLTRWLALQLKAERGEATPVPAQAVRESHRPRVSLDSAFGRFTRKGYGLGWYSGPYDGAPLYHAFGGFTGFRAHVSFMPSRDLGVAVLSNDEGIGFRLVDVIAAYAYDWYGHGADYARKQAEPALEKLAAMQRKLPGELAKTRAAHARRPWRLSHPLAAYAGRYCNPDWGEVEVRRKGGKLVVRLGRLSAVAEPYDRPESVRVELVPHSGEVLTFRADAGRRVTGLALESAEFVRGCGRR
jgi:CubicO group peptidase (beta-lactamase class C family)